MTSVMTRAFITSYSNYILLYAIWPHAIYGWLSVRVSVGIRVQPTRKFTLSDGKHSKKHYMFRCFLAGERMKSLVYEALVADVDDLTLSVAETPIATSRCCFVFAVACLSSK